MANKDKEKKDGYLQSVALDFKLLGVGLELGTFGYRVQRSTTRPSRLGANLRRDATSRLLFLDQSALADFDPRKKKEPHLRLVAFQARVMTSPFSCSAASSGLPRLFQMSKLSSNWGPSSPGQELLCVSRRKFANLDLPASAILKSSISGLIRTEPV